MSNIVLSGVVVHGDGYGKKIGFPTANIDRRMWSRLVRKPRLGVYAGVVTICHCEECGGTHAVTTKPSTLRGSDCFGCTRNDESYKAGMVIGPIDRKGLPKLEAHLVGFSGDLYGKKIVFILRAYLRPFKKYTTEQKLIADIQNDIKHVRNSVQL